MAFLELSHLQKSFGATQVVREMNLGVAKGEFVSFLGPSGCGKTTTLRMIAGFETPSAGAIRVDGRDITRLKPNERQVGMVFQSYALFPNMTVADNIAFGLRVASRPKPEIAGRVAEMLALIKLPALAARYPYQLSGGQQQRVALARALASRPQILLLDEPLSALDAKIRVSLRDEIKAVQRALGITTIYVTHDQEEALSMSDRVVVMSEGRIEQAGPPHEIYNFPATPFVASFVGTLNLLKGRVLDPGLGKISIDGQEIVTTRPVPPALLGKEAMIALRPEAVTLGEPRDGGLVAGGMNQLAGSVEDVDFLGSIVRVKVRFAENAVSVDTFNNPNLAPPARGMKVDVAFAPSDVLVLAGEG